MDNTTNEQAPSALAALLPVSLGKIQKESHDGSIEWYSAYLYDSDGNYIAEYNWSLLTGNAPAYPAWLTELVATLNAAPAQAAELVALRAEVERLEESKPLNSEMVRIINGALAGEQHKVRNYTAFLATKLAER